MKEAKQTLNELTPDTVIALDESIYSFIFQIDKTHPDYDVKILFYEEPYKWGKIPESPLFEINVPLHKITAKTIKFTKNYSNLWTIYEDEGEQYMGIDVSLAFAHILQKQKQYLKDLAQLDGLPFCHRKLSNGDLLYRLEIPAHKKIFFMDELTLDNIPRSFLREIPQSINKIYMGEQGYLFNNKKNSNRPQLHFITQIRGGELYGGPGNDVLIGNEGSDFLASNEGNDILCGGSGDDVLVSLEGEDILKGGFGDDIYRSYSPGAIHVVDRGRNIHKCTSSFTLMPNKYCYNTRDSIFTTGNEIFIDLKNIFVEKIEIRPNLVEGALTKIIINSEDDVVFHFVHRENPIAIKFLQFPHKNLTLSKTLYPLPASMTSFMIYPSHLEYQNEDSDNEALIGELSENVAYGGKGNDKLVAIIDTDTICNSFYLHGGPGDDFLMGNEYDDVMIGGSGADILWGKGGQDVFEYDAQDQYMDLEEDEKLYGPSFLLTYQQPDHHFCDFLSAPQRLQGTKDIFQNGGLFKRDGHRFSLEPLLTQYDQRGFLNFKTATSDFLQFNHLNGKDMIVVQDKSLHIFSGEMKILKAKQQDFGSSFTYPRISLESEFQSRFYDQNFPIGYFPINHKTEILLQSHYYVNIKQEMQVKIKPVITLRLAQFLNYSEKLIMDLEGDEEVDLPFAKTYDHLDQVAMDYPFTFISTPHTPLNGSKHTTVMMATKDFMKKGVQLYKEGHNSQKDLKISIAFAKPNGNQLWVMPYSETNLVFKP